MAKRVAVFLLVLAVLGLSGCSNELLARRLTESVFQDVIPRLIRATTV